MAPSVEHAAPRASSEAVRLRVGDLLGRYSKAELRAALEALANRFSERLVRVKPELSALGVDAAVRTAIRELEEELGESLAQSNRGKLRDGVRHLIRAESLLAGVEAHARALSEIATAKEALRGHVARWKLERYLSCPTLRSFARILETTAPEAVRRGLPEHACELARVVRRELESLELDGAGAAHRARCAACAERGSRLSDDAREILNAIENRGHAELANLLRCELESATEWSVTAAGGTGDARSAEVRARAVELTAAIQRQTAALREFAGTSDTGDGSGATVSEESR